MRGIILRIIIALLTGGCAEQRLLEEGMYNVQLSQWNLTCPQAEDMSELYESRAWLVSLPKPDGYWVLTIGDAYLNGEEQGNDVVFKETFTAYDPERLDTHAVIHAAMGEDKLIARMQIYQTEQQSTPEPIPSCVNMWDVEGVQQ